jgi:hypothetical protein
MKASSDSGIRLFIADNDQNIINSIKRTVVSKFGDEIESSECPIEAMKKMKVFKPDILITDINFSHDEAGAGRELITAGVRLAREVRKEFPRTKIIAVSGYRNNDEVFEKIVEKDWYDHFHTKGNDDLYEKYASLREAVNSERTGLVPFLSRFFSPLNHGFDPEKSFYRLLHTNYDRSENLKLLIGIHDYYSKFKSMLERSNSEFIDKCLEAYKTRDLTVEERNEAKNRFHIKSNELECLFGSIRSTIYAEKNIIEEVWSKIISETKDNSDISRAEFGLNFTDNSIIISVKQNMPFDFSAFTASGRTLSIYKKVHNYGDIIIQSGTASFSVVSEKMTPSEKFVNGAVIEFRMKSLPR